ncbi:MAG TPA: hypothetical protein VHP32_05500 [Ignavibacteria bacterium]|nr:hypothetical protein [Ignavibacteria bacterium]
MANCINCGQELTGKYCANCGQSADTHRYDFKLIIKDFFDVFYKFKSSIFHSIKLNYTHPVQSINNYFIGKRIEFYNPLRYVFFISVLNSFLLIKSIHLTSIPAAPDDPLVEKFIKLYLSNMSIIDMLEIPVISLFTFLLFRKRKLNYPENLVANCFLFGNLFLVNILVTLVQWLFHSPAFVEVTDEIFFWSGVVYFIIIYTLLFKENFVSGILKSLLAVMLSKIIYVCLVIAYTEIF